MVVRKQLDFLQSPPPSNTFLRNVWRVSLGCPANFAMFVGGEGWPIKAQSFLSFFFLVPWLFLFFPRCPCREFFFAGGPSHELVFFFSYTPAHRPWKYSTSPPAWRLTDFFAARIRWPRQSPQRFFPLQPRSVVRGPSPLQRQESSASPSPQLSIPPPPKTVPPPSCPLRSLNPPARSWNRSPHETPFLLRRGARLFVGNFLS